MASAWASGLPVSAVRMGDTPKRLTLVLPFYMNHGFLIDQLSQWAHYPSDLAEHLSVIVVDDGSPEPVTKPMTNRFDLRLFRIEVDVPWNWLAARNIGAHYAETPWLLLTDIDHVLPAETLRSLVYGHHDPSVVYVFSRIEHTGTPVQPHSASFFLTRELFWKIGGYDETFSGLYGTDGLYRKRVRAVAPIHVLPDSLIRHEFVGDSSTTRYTRKSAADIDEIRKISARLPADHAAKVLTFPYHEVGL